jgi:AraC-like DNA-binding protein
MDGKPDEVERVGHDRRHRGAVSRLDRYALAHHFRALLGTSPYRDLVMRWLDRARALMRSGNALADAACAAGFADRAI